MTVTLSPEDIKKFTAACHDWESNRVRGFLDAIKANAFSPSIDWQAVERSWKAQSGPPFPNLYQVLGL